MKRLYFLLLATTVSATTAFSQASSCTQVLRLVQSTYEQGRLHELSNIMEGCLNGVGEKAFTKAEKREALRYKTLAHIYLEEPEEADKSMLQLLETDHFYTINPAVDPAEFIALYKKFRTTPLFRIGLKFGSNVTLPTTLKSYYVGSEASGQGSYAVKPNIQLLAVFEKDLGGKFKKFVVAPEIGLQFRSFDYSNGSLALDTTGTTPISSQTFSFSQTWLDLNGIVQYKFKNTVNLQTFIGGGPGISYLMGSSVQPNTVLGNGFTVTGPSIDDKVAYKKLVYSFTVVAGAKLKIGELYLIGDVRYQYGFTNVVDPAHRTVPEIAFDYQYVYNDYRMSNFSINVGVLYPWFSPKKLIK